MFGGQPCGVGFGFQEAEGGDAVDTMARNLAAAGVGVQPGQLRCVVTRCCRRCRAPPLPEPVREYLTGDFECLDHLFGVRVPGQGTLPEQRRMGGLGGSTHTGR